MRPGDDELKNRWKIIFISDSVSNCVNLKAARAASVNKSKGTLIITISKLKGTLGFLCVDEWVLPRVMQKNFWKA